MQNKLLSETVSIESLVFLYINAIPKNMIKSNATKSKLLEFLQNNARTLENNPKVFYDKFSKEFIIDYEEFTQYVNNIKDRDFDVIYHQLYKHFVNNDADIDINDTGYLQYKDFISTQKTQGHNTILYLLYQEFLQSDQCKKYLDIINGYYNLVFLENHKLLQHNEELKKKLQDVKGYYIASLRERMHKAIIHDNLEGFKGRDLLKVVFFVNIFMSLLHALVALVVDILPISVELIQTFFIVSACVNIIASLGSIYFVASTRDKYASPIKESCFKSQGKGMMFIKMMEPMKWGFIIGAYLNNPLVMFSGIFLGLLLIYIGTPKTVDKVKAEESWKNFQTSLKTLQTNSLAIKNVVD